jgi:RecA-family ATPase
MESADVTNNLRHLPEIENAADLIADQTVTMPPEVIKGVLHKGSKGVLGGSSKTFKTWALIDAAVSVSAGLQWWGWEATKGKVLYINFELGRPFIRLRIQAVCQKRGVFKPTDFELWNLRGHSAPFYRLMDPIIQKVRDRAYTLIITAKAQPVIMLTHYERLRCLI